MKVYTNCSELKCEIEKLCRIFFPFEKFLFEENDNADIKVVCFDDCVNSYVKYGDKNFEFSEKINDFDIETTACRTLYRCLCEALNYVSKWGILTGVRPAKLMHRICENIGEEKAKSDFQNRLLVSEQKTQLAFEVMKHENEIISLSKDNSFSLYISIPFCPTRCSYCSFVSHSVNSQSAKKLVEPYVELLCKELEETGRIAKELNLRLETVYFGGGTPTTLSAEQLEKLFKTVESNFDLTHLREYTVEAGRPDTVTKEKLFAIKNAGATRISINPQTFSDEVLETIGRNHNSQQTIDAYKLACDCGFDNINMDLIAGLPNDTVSSFKNSVDTAVKLGAQNITVHSLAMKTASYMAGNRENTVCTPKEANEMVDYSFEALKNNGYYPYYMYRQSKTVGNLENVGWCKNGKDGLYNVYMMDETHSVFGCGGGAVTKLRSPVDTKIERIYNFKYPYEYIDRFDEMITRKSGIYDFYKEYR